MISIITVVIRKYLTHVLAFRMEVQIVCSLDIKYSVDSFITGVFGVMWIIYRHWENCILSFFLNVEVPCKVIFRSHLTHLEK